MARPRPTLIRAVANLLQEPAEDAEELAERIIALIDELESEREKYAVVKTFGSDPRNLGAIGPFNTRKQAEKAISSGLIPFMPGERYQICPIFSERRMEKAQEHADKPPEHLRSDVPLGHPKPYPATDIKSRQRFQRMTKKEKLAETKRRMSA